MDTDQNTQIEKNEVKRDEIVNSEEADNNEKNSKHKYNKLKSSKPFLKKKFKSGVNKRKKSKNLIDFHNQKTLESKQNKLGLLKKSKYTLRQKISNSIGKIIYSMFKYLENEDENINSNDNESQNKTNTSK